jgi:type I restriction-modification system DNA methylase subunit
VWPNGIPDFRKIHSDRFALFTDARKDFESAWENWDSHQEDEAVLSFYRVARDLWVSTVLKDVVGWGEFLLWGESGGFEAFSPNRTVAVKSQALLRSPERIGALVCVFDPVDSLRQSPNDLWAATPIDRMEELLRVSGIPVGVVTDGRWWAIVSARPGFMPASGVFDALTWTEEPRTRDAFMTLLGRQYLIGGDPSERLPALFEESIAAAEEITEALGVQIRKAVELLVQSFSESAAEASRKGLPDPIAEQPRIMYEAAVTVMMRTVFLLFAEERGLLPTGEFFEQGYGMSNELDRLQALESDEEEEALDATSLSWHRLLATCSALFNGATFENLRMPAYGGSLFDPSRFPELSATTEEGTLSIAVSDRVMLHVLRAVQIALLKGGEARQISFRDIDVEQIGYIYEGLLGYSVIRVNETYLGLKGTDGSEPEIPLSKLEELVGENPGPEQLAQAIRAWIELDQPSAKAQSKAAIIRGFSAEVDPGLLSALSQVVGGDKDLGNRIKPWLGLIRRDLRSHPFIVLPNGLLVKETPSRKNAGAHYTPKSLAEEVVLYALQPLCYSPGPHQVSSETEWKLRPSEEILDLKVADIACGSGAFLVAAARYLADRLVEAWISEDPENAHRKDLHVRAIRQVVANCLYGADINEMAVEMAKLSLWLVSLDRDLPFSFVDDKIFLGNSLLGLTSLDQLRTLHIYPSRAAKEQVLDLFQVDVESIVRKAIDLREHLATEIDTQDPARTAAAKSRQLAQLQVVTGLLRIIADGVIAAGLPLGGKPGKVLDEAYENLRLAVRESLVPRGINEPLWLDTILSEGLTPTVSTDYFKWDPLHWFLKAPDVMIDHGGFDSVIGNPPFLGGKKISPSSGSNLREWFVNVLANGVTGNADLVAYFFLRALSLLRPEGTIGLIATNTIAQGDTREVGLRQMLASGFTITRSIRSAPWPAASANLEYAAVWGTTYQIPESVTHMADGQHVVAISSLLEAEGRTQGEPIMLKENSGVAFIGSNVNGMGFTMTWQVADSMLRMDPHYSRVIKPFLGGKDVNSNSECAATRWIVDFDRMKIEEAATYLAPFEWVRENVFPHRQTLVNKPHLQDTWWRYESNGTGWRIAVQDFENVLVLTLVSKTGMPARVPVGQLFAHSLAVFATDSYADQAVLSSTAHQIWALTYGSGLRNDPRYTPSSVFETFPRPIESAWLRSVGQRLEVDRCAAMLRRDLGLTKFYNRINDPTVRNAEDLDVAMLRNIHAELDAAVMAAYGWEDIPLEHGFFEDRQIRRWTVCPVAREEILNRLLAENHKRAAHEAASSAVVKKVKKSHKMSGQEETLFT